MRLRSWHLALSGTVIFFWGVIDAPQWIDYFLSCRRSGECYPPSQLELMMRTWFVALILGAVTPALFLRPQNRRTDAAVYLCLLIAYLFLVRDHLASGQVADPVSFLVVLLAWAFLSLLSQSRIRQEMGALVSVFLGIGMAVAFWKENLHLSFLNPGFLSALFFLLAGFSFFLSGKKAEENATISK